MSRKANSETPDRVRIEYSQDNIPPEKEDFFKVEGGKDPNFHYHWARNDPRRVHQLKREGYEIAPASSKEAKEQVEYQKKSLMKQLNDPEVSEANKKMAKEVLTILEQAPKDAPLGIAEGVLMRTPMANRLKRMEARQNALKGLEDSIEASIQDLDAGLKRSGRGGIEALKELLHRSEERDRRRNY